MTARWCLVGLLALLPAGAAAPQAQPARGLWVLRAPAAIVEYDLATFSPTSSVDVPRWLIDHPEGLSVNAKGQIMFVPATAIPEGGGEPGASVRRAWFWDGRRATTLSLERSTPPRKLPDGTSVTETVARPFLSAAGDSVIWFENAFEKTLDRSGAERSVRASARAWRTDLAGGRSQPMTSLSSTGACECATGVCSETCPEWQLWAPDGVVGAFVLLTRFVPGQIGTSYQETRLALRGATSWTASPLPKPIEQPLDASGTGAILLSAVLDGGCCGWANEGDDQLLLWQGGAVSVVYDERRRYGNDNYDVSIYPTTARLAPSARLGAYTIASSARTPEEIRLSSEGKDNAEELARIRRAVAGLPAVEIVPLAPGSRPAAAIRRAELVGWIGDRELLVAQDGQLVVYDTAGIKRRETGIRVRSAADAFLREAR